MSRSSDLVIPDSHEDAFREIGGLRGADLARLLDAIEKGADEGSAQALADALAHAEFSNAEVWADALLSGCVTRSHLQLSASQMAEEIATVIDADAESQHSIGAALGNSSLLVMAKAKELANLGRLMTGARLISDVRPVFDEDIVSQPIGAVVIHTLELTYIDDAYKRHALSVHLDGEDIELLSTQLLRARDKERELGLFLKGAGLRQFGNEGS